MNVNITALNCPNCGAPLPYQVGRPLAICIYCGTTSQISMTDGSTYQATTHSQPLTAEEARQITNELEMMLLAEIDAIRAIDRQVNEHHTEYHAQFKKFMGRVHSRHSGYPMRSLQARKRFEPPLLEAITPLITESRFHTEKVGLIIRQLIRFEQDYGIGGLAHTRLSFRLVLDTVGTGGRGAGELLVERELLKFSSGIMKDKPQHIYTSTFYHDVLSLQRELDVYQVLSRVIPDLPA